MREWLRKHYVTFVFASSLVWFAVAAMLILAFGMTKPVTLVPLVMCLGGIIATATWVAWPGTQVASPAHPATHDEQTRELTGVEEVLVKSLAKHYINTRPKVGLIEHLGLLPEHLVTPFLDEVAKLELERQSR